MLKPGRNGSTRVHRRRAKALTSARRAGPDLDNGKPGRSSRTAHPGGAALAPLHDKQSERDHRELRIDKVGVRGLLFPIQVRDKARAVQNTVATIGMFVDLPKEFKGTHMSRFLEVLN